MLVQIRVVEHRLQRYPTTGDWMFDGGGRLHVSVSDMGNDDYHFLVGTHEQIEAWLCRKAGVDPHDVDLFDELYEIARDPDYTGPNTLRERFGCSCDITEISEPGDDIHAPYYKQHQLATAVERVLATELGVSWNDYETANLKLYEEA